MTEPSVDVQFALEREVAEWKSPSKVRGVTLDSFAELQKIIKPDKKFGKVFLRETRQYGRVCLEVYSQLDVKRPLKLRNVAYGCGSCLKIMIDAPEIKAVNTIRGLSGRESLEYYCKNCNKKMYEEVFRKS